MSQISTFYDALVTKLGTTLPSHTRIPTPEKVEENPETTLRQGQGFFINSDTNTNLNLSCKFSSDVEVVIVMTRKVYASELDVTAIDTAKKLVLEDNYTVRQAIENDFTLGTSDTVTKFNYVSHTGIQFVFLEKDNFIKIEATYALTLVDDI